VLAALPNVLTESSGIEITEIGWFWSFNDGGGRPELYAFDRSGNLKSTLKISNATNVDWEDITQDSLGNLFIGDFGNNNNGRTDLKIYKIVAPVFGSPSLEQSAEIIQFNFEDQTGFPPPQIELQFDAEAMFANKSWLYILTKDRSKPFESITKLYRINICL